MAPPRSAGSSASSTRCFSWAVRGACYRRFIMVWFDCELLWMRASVNVNVRSTCEPDGQHLSEHGSLRSWHLSSTPGVEPATVRSSSLVSLSLQTRQEVLPEDPEPSRSEVPPVQPAAVRGPPQQIPPLPTRPLHGYVYILCIFCVLYIFYIFYIFCIYYIFSVFYIFYIF